LETELPATGAGPPGVGQKALNPFFDTADGADAAPDQAEPPPPPPPQPPQPQQEQPQQQLQLLLQPLPQGWATSVSRSSGETYYVNQLTGESTYDRPNAPATYETGLGTPGQAVEDGTASSPPQIHVVGQFGTAAVETPALPQGWVTSVSRSSGETYYVNQMTGESTYDRPTAQATHETGLGTPPAPGSSPDSGAEHRQAIVVQLRDGGLPDDQRARLAEALLDGRYPPTSAAAQQLVSENRYAGEDLFSQAISALKHGAKLDKVAQQEGSAARFIEVLEVYAYGVRLIEQACAPAAQLAPEVVAALESKRLDVSRAFPSCTRSILTETYLCHACSCQEIEDMETPGQVLARVAAHEVRLSDMEPMVSDMEPMVSDMEPAVSAQPASSYAPPPSGEEMAAWKTGWMAKQWKDKSRLTEQKRFFMLDAAGLHYFAAPPPHGSELGVIPLRGCNIPAGVGWSGKEFELETGDGTREQPVRTLILRMAVADAAELFKTLDADHSGYLDAAEVATLCKAMGRKMNKKALRQAMTEMDLDGSEEVNFSEFEQWWTTNGGEQSTDTVRLWVEAIDAAIERGGGRQLPGTLQPDGVAVLPPADDGGATGRGGWAQHLRDFGRTWGSGQIGLLGPRQVAEGAAAVASSLEAALTEIYLCNACSCQEILRRNGRGQV
jgi:hypothetical protein